MKRLLIGAITIVLSFSILSGCDKKQQPETNEVVTQNGETEEVSGEVIDGVEASATEENAPQLSVDEMKEMYLDFIKGNTKMTVKNADISWYEEGKEYSYDEMNAEFAQEMQDMWEEINITDAYYAFIDCGDDGISEFVTRQVYRFNIDGAELYNIYKVIDGKVCCVFSDYGYYRSFIEVNEYGYITYGGSGGAGTYYCYHNYVDKDGNEIFLYSEIDEMGLSGAYIPNYMFPVEEVPEEYPSDIYAYNDDYKCLSAYNFEKYEYDENNTDSMEYEKNYFFSFCDFDGNDIEPDEDIAKIYKECGIKYYSCDESNRMVEEHVTSLGASEKIRTGEECQWNSLLSVGVGEYSKSVIGYYGIMESMPGKWKIPEEDLADGISGVFFNVHETGEFEVNINYTDSYTSPAYITGHFSIQYDSNIYNDVMGLYINTSNSSLAKEKNYLGFYSVDDYVLNSDTVTITLGGDASYFFEQCISKEKPVFVKEYRDEIYDKAVRVYNISEEYFCNDEESTDRIVVPVDLNLNSCVENQITDDNVWISKLGVNQLGETYSDDNYIYRFGGVEGYGTYTALYIYDKATNELIKTFDFHEFVRANGYEASDFVDRSIRFALIKDNILYLNLFHRTYASSCPSNAYIMAIDMNYGSVIWKSQPLVSNSYNFVILGDSIITGYGFTAEDHYLSVVNRFNGSVLGKIGIKKSPEYFYYKDGILYVRTYSYDYEFGVE